MTDTTDQLQDDEKGMDTIHTLGGAPAGPATDAQAPVEEHLAEFDHAMQPKLDDMFTEPEPSAGEIDLLLDDDGERRAAETLRINNLIDNLSQGGAAAQQRAENLTRALQEMQEREYWRHQDEAWNKFTAEAAKDFKEFDDLPANYIRDRLELLAVRDKQFQAAWFGREQNPRAWQVAQTQALKALNTELKSRPDRELTADIAAVVHAMRGASGKAPPEPSPDYGRMPAAEARKHVIDNYGFDPGWT